MSQTEAIARAQVLKEALLDHGVKAVSIELVQGRGPSAHPWWTDTFVGSLGHHIVSRRSQGLTPFLWLVKQGRSDLPGPICNGYGGFDEVARIISLGWANHPGYGGPLPVELGTIPMNNGRPYLFGWEFEGGLSETDWPDSMHEFMARCLAGTLDWVGSLHSQELTSRSHAEHKTWAPTRKTDRLSYTLEEARAAIDPYLGDDMVTRADKADNGLEVLRPHFNKAVAAGVASSEHTQPGGVAFNDEVFSVLDRMGLFDVYDKIRTENQKLWDRLRVLETANAQLRKDLELLKAAPPTSGTGVQFGQTVVINKP